MTNPFVYPHQILLLCVATYIPFLLLNRKGEIFSQLYSEWTCSKKVALMLIVLQVLLVILFPAYRIVVMLYFFLSFIGIHPAIALAPGFLKTKSSLFVLAPLWGLLLTSITGAYLIGFNLQIKLIPPVLLTLALIMAFLNFRFGRQSLSGLFLRIRTNWTSSVCNATLCITPLIFLIILPTIQVEPLVTSYYRLGPDMALYTKMSQYLLDGGTWAQSKLRASEFQGMSVGEINSYCDATLSWGFMHYFRWGLTAYQALATLITFSKHSYHIAFISMSVPYLLVAGLVYLWLAHLMTLGFPLAALGAAAFALNPNLLNMWYEGFYGNVYALEFFVLILFFFSYIRSVSPIPPKDTRKLGITLSALIAAGLSSYGEGIVFVLLPFMAGIFVLDFLMNKKLKWKPYLLVLISVCVGLASILPCKFILKWFALSFSNMKNEGGNGYPQPLWALPNEILGFHNIYLNPSIDTLGQVLHRSTLLFFSGVLLSILILTAIVTFLRKQWKEERVIYLTSIFMVIASAILVVYRSRHNYTYMKMYVFHLPFLFVLFWCSIGSLFKGPIAGTTKNKIHWCYLAFALPMILNGVVYIYQFKRQAIPITEERISLHEKLRSLDLNQVIFYPMFEAKGHFILDLLYRDMYPAILPAPWIVKDKWIPAYASNFLDYKVYNFLEKGSGKIKPNLAKKILFEDSHFMIFDTGKTVRDGINKVNNSINFDTFASFDFTKL